MSMWLYQLTQAEWPTNEYRLDIWEGERWRWGVKKVEGKKRPVPGDTICFYYAKSGCPTPGFVGWAVVLQFIEEDGVRRVYFRPVAPSDELKMRPWSDDEAEKLADVIRVPIARGTLWPVNKKLAADVGKGIARWLRG